MKKLTLGMLLASASLTATAAEDTSLTNWVGGISYINLSDEVEDGLDISIGGIVGSLGYKIRSGHNFYLIPEVRVGRGISADSFSYLGVYFEVELDGFIALSLRGQFELNNGIYIFAAPSYANAKISASASQGGDTFSATEDSWDFGIGVGAGYNFTEKASAEVMYEQFDGTDALSLGLRFNF